MIKHIKLHNDETGEACQAYGPASDIVRITFY